MSKATTQSLTMLALISASFYFINARKIYKEPEIKHYVSLYH